MMVKKFADGEKIPDGSKYIRSEYLVVGYKEEVHPRFDPAPIMKLYHWYEVPE